MNKTGIKNYAIQARKDLIKGVQLKAFDLGITQDKIEHNTIESNDTFVVHGRVLSQKEKRQRESLLKAIHHKGHDQVMEEVAYTWFNRFCALRYMEVNHYLPSKVRVFTNTSNEFKPEILKEVLQLEWETLNQNEVIRLIELNQEDQLYRYLLITQCNDMHRYLPGMFEKLDDYTEALLPEGLLRAGSVLDQMIQQIPEEDWKEQVEIIGWLYQFYNAEVKDETYALLKKNVKVTKERVPSVTQLFTPDWIVRYMVENSLGRLWVEGHPRSELKTSWTYYLEEAKQEAEVEKQLQQIRQEYAKIQPESIKVIDPSMGSGHILVYAFDVLMQIYSENGYSETEAARKILEYNLYGLDIDDRAYQLAYFALMMRARKHDIRIFTRNIQPQVYSIQESNPLSEEVIHYIAQDNRILEDDVRYILTVFKDAKEYGSILKVKPVRFESLYERIHELQRNAGEDQFSLDLFNQVIELFIPLLKQAEVLSQKYDVSITNPPYMGYSGMSVKLGDYVKKHYPDSKSDLFAVFMEQCINLIKPNRYQAMITMHSWMFLSSYEKLREKILNSTIINMAHLGAHAFEEIGGEVVQATVYILSKWKNSNYLAKYKRLVHYGSEDKKRIQFNQIEDEYIKKSIVYTDIPGSPIAYWVSKKIFTVFEGFDKLEKYAQPRQGMATCNNEKFLRYWYEPNIYRIGFNHVDKKDALKGCKKWFPYHKGGGFRKWFGNLFFVVDWENDGEEIKELVIKKYPYLNGNYEFVLKTNNPYFKEGITWSDVSTGDFACRYSPIGFMYDVKGTSMFPSSDIIKYTMGLLNTKLIANCLNILNPTMSYQVGNIKSLPMKVDLVHLKIVDLLVNENLSLSQTDWDSFETSWDFKLHPMLVHKGSNVQASYEAWKQFTQEQFAMLKANEEELNRIFIEIYGLEDELTPEVDDKDITITRITDVKSDEDKKNRYSMDKTESIKTFVSYAVGCMFGRYSLDQEGLVYAGGVFDSSRYVSYPVDGDNIIPVSDDDYFNDDITSRFVKFVEMVYGKESLEANLKFIADALGSKGITSREVIRSYFLNEFYKDHLKVYQKKPIYWLFDSGKKNGFKALVYLHRYQSDLLAKMRVDYVHQQQERYRSLIEHTQQMIQQAEGSKEKVSATNQLSKLIEQERELKGYEEKLKHLSDQRIEIDLDDGVSVNYAKFDGLVSPIK
jgi:type II restriction/modification system DNA methylase subunit YeeA